eukprot:5033607-Prymnesium_polylepis.3
MPWSARVHSGVAPRAAHKRARRSCTCSRSTPASSFEATARAPHRRGCVRIEFGTPVWSHGSPRLSRPGRRGGHSTSVSGAESDCARLENSELDVISTSLSPSASRSAKTCARRSSSASSASL